MNRLPLSLLFGLIVSSAAWTGAQACEPGNLMAGRRPWAWQDIRGQLAAVTDGKVAPEGAVWNTPLAAVLDTAAATMTWDLGQPRPVRAVWIQADNNDDYHLWGSQDGQQFVHLATIPAVPGQGLRARAVSLPGDAIRYLRVGEGLGDGAYSLSEVQAFCQPPSAWPPPVTVAPAPLAGDGRGLFAYWNDDTSARWELVLALLGLALLLWGWHLRRHGRPQAFQRLRDRLLMALGLVAALTYVNFGCFHFGNFIHTHEWTHYYLGSKYFPELGYTRLYECLSLADIEDGLRRRVELRKITNLGTNALERQAQVLTDPAHCRRHFSAARWRQFADDTRLFRTRLGGSGWDKVFLDHGYNATPVWNTAGAFLAGLAPASNTQLYLLALLDPLYLLGCLAVVWWAFGWRVLAVALLVFATNFPSRFYWTGGAFLRWDWLFFLLAAIACLKRQRPLLAGGALAVSALLRVFPVFVFAGPLLAAGHHLWRRRTDPALPALPSWQKRFLVGAALAGALLVPLSLVATDGIARHRQFIDNTVKHQNTPLVNHLGLRTLLSWRPHQVGRLTHDERLTDPWLRWKQARLHAYAQARPLLVLLALGYLALLALAAPRLPPWALAALGVGLIAFAVELTSYYYMFIFAVALLHARREEVGLSLLLLTAFTQFIAWAPLPGMARWSDEQHVAMSAGSVIVFGVILWLIRRPESAPDPA